jgi:hypothetical protein
MMFTSHPLNEQVLLIAHVQSPSSKTLGVKTCNQTNIPGLQIYSRPIKRDDIRSSASAFVRGEGARNS